MPEQRFVAKVAKSNGVWVIVVDGLGVTQTDSEASIVTDAVDLVAGSLRQPREGVSVEVVVVADPDLTDMASPANVIRARAKQWRDGWELHVGSIGVTQSLDLASAPQQVADYVATVTGREVLATDVEVVLRAGGVR